MVELQFAEWLESQGWTIGHLEAWGAAHDIEATNAEGDDAAFEIKFIGIEDAAFDLRLKSIAGDAAAGSLPLYSAVNYLLFRVYEAARQLRDAAQSRIAVIIVEDWSRFDFQLKGKWIKWGQPEFIGAEPEWESFLRTQEKKYPSVSSDLASVVAGLDAVWIVPMSDSGFDLECIIPIPHA
jgi:hypothetical protein